METQSTLGDLSTSHQTKTEQSEHQYVSQKSPYPTVLLVSSPEPIQTPPASVSASHAMKRPAAFIDLTVTPGASPSVTKRPRLTPEEKAAQLAEQEAKRLEREERKKAKEVERLQKEAEAAERKAQAIMKQKAQEAERLQKEQAREEKRRAQEEKRMSAESAKRQKEEAEAKKARAQPKLSCFFQKVEAKVPALLPHSSISCFKPFQVKEHMTMAAMPKPGDEVSFCRAISGQDAPAMQAQAFRERRARRLVRRDKYKTLQQVMHETSSIPLVQRLTGIPTKLAQFHSDVRPPYFGTYTKVPSTAGLRSGRNPFAKGDGFDYDYDSEAEWEDDLGDGEDLGDEDDARSLASLDTYNEDDASFLDDAEDGENREARRSMAQMIPVLRGPFVGVSPEAMEAVGHLSLQGLIDTRGKAIDPFHNYWDEPKTIKKGTPPGKGQTTLLATATGNSAALLQLSAGKTNSKKRPATIAIPEAQVPTFKKHVQGSSLSKMLLVEKLYQEFGQQLTKKAIQETLEAVAERQGQGRHDVWVLI
ncbi:chromatin assembly factor 1 subunit A-domain-containing protein [Protomyces lactucae-debilis]|uniref:Chromatin assembly factor 1 subunit A-domain-containing protein n=1 Tax=Protomyces lactucae-debilis TaxID=2754530 RepID=A0A1Y2F547_PROLT|nr:chromatin assembly factor 1 subunit A-domain-containing protein [Protomyces lactucae-debilis]ORY79048.1 chromatin assembly factor 1 subunit A-domain-containing protein [Protomyces lactucae-debilis]